MVEQAIQMALLPAAAYHKFSLPFLALAETETDD